MLMTQLQDDNLRQSVMQYIKQTANGMDIGADSKVLIQTLARESVKNQKHAVVWKSRTKKSVVVGVLSVVLAIGVQFFVNYCTNELSKESHVDEQGAMVSTSGKVVKTQMDEMQVGSDGRLVSRDGKSNVKTMPTLARVGLSSSLPDKTLMGLDEIVVYSDKGYTLQIKVHGFSRIPVLNSRCGNVVHFYTAWKGKISLDSTDLSFDEATAAEFEKAGFSLAMGGRRLGGGNKLEGFFKALESANASGKWTCADVPLPTIPRTRIVKSTTHWPCTSGRCSSKYGSYLPGVGQAGRDFAKAIASSTAKILGNFALDMYMKTQSTHFVSDRYQVTTEIMPQHPGQELVSVFDAKKQYYQTFQSQSANKTKSHCSNEKNKQTDTNDEMHFEYVGTDEESGIILRHFRMQRNSDYIRQVAGDDVRATVTEFWDIAESMQPLRVLDGDGTVIMMESVKASVSDAEIEEHFGKLLGECSSEEKAKDQNDHPPPKMKQFLDLEYEDLEYYREQKFGHDEVALENAATKGDGFATYLTRALDPFSTSDDCKQKCKKEIDMVFSEAQQGKLQDCSGTDSHLRVAFDCLNSHAKHCDRSNFYASHLDDCLGATEKTSNATARALETDEAEPEVSLLNNDTMVVAGRARALEMPHFWENNCLSAWMIPAPHIFPTLVEYDPGKTDWTWPVCMQMQWDENWKKAETNWLLFKALENGKVGFQRYQHNKDQKAKFTLRLTWVYIRGTLAITITAKACIDAAKPLTVPPPLELQLCVEAWLTVSIRPVCPGGKRVHMSGGFRMGIYGSLNLWIASIPLGHLEVGVMAGIAWTWTGWCWWIRTPEGPSRRRTWDRRRRNVRRCTGRSVCDMYVKGWIGLQLAIIHTIIDMVWWQKSKRLESTLTIKVYRFWSWSQDWFVSYQKMIWQKQM